MPYKRYDPAPEADMDKRMKGDNTLCNILRDMYHLSNDPGVKLKCRLAFSMGKAMCQKLTEYKQKYGMSETEYEDGI
jgi:hypothetical protein